MTKKRGAIGAGLLILIVALVFHRVPFNEFTNLDDPSHFDNNPYFEPLTLKNVAQVWTKPHLLYIPMTYSVWALAAKLSGKTAGADLKSQSGIPRNYKYHPFWFHFLSWTFHLANTVGVYTLLLLMGFTMLPAFLAALCFGIHPVQVEAVAWASALKDTLSTFFLLTGLLSFFFWRKRRLGWAVGLSSLSLVLALLAKPTAVVMPLIAALLLLWQGVGRRSFPWQAFVAWFFILCPFAALAMSIQSTDSLPFVAPNWGDRILIALDAIGFYLTKLAGDFRFSIDYGRAPTVALASSDFPIHLILALSFLGLVTWSARRSAHSTLVWGSLIFLAALIPVLGFKPFSFQTTSTVGNRYLYVPMLGVALVFARLMTRGKLWQRGGVVILLILTVFTVRETYYWRDTLSLFGRGLLVNPRSWLLENNLGSFYERLDQYELALQHYQRCVELKPQSVAYNNMGAIYLLLNRPQQAKHAYEASLHLNPLSSVDWNGRGYACVAMQDKACAQESFQRALQIAPSLEPARLGLAALEHEKNRPQ